MEPWNIPRVRFEEGPLAHASCTEGRGLLDLGTADGRTVINACQLAFERLQVRISAIVTKRIGAS
jgi:hypothetical protein